MFVQDFLIYLIDGTMIPASEPMDLEGPDSFLDRFANAEPDELFSIGDSISGYVVFPARSIVYIRTGDVREVDDWPFRMQAMLKGLKSKNNERR